MIEIEQPEVFLIAEPMLNTAEMMRYLHGVGGEAWAERALASPIPAAEGLVEFMGRLCYKSWEPGLNKNVTKIREDRGDYLLNVLRSAHGSVLEHASFSFVIHDCSRVLTAELNRHRAGVAISEQSLRYVRLDELRFRLPPILRPETRDYMRIVVEGLEEDMAHMMSLEGLDEPGLDFARKKTITSALRRAAPLGLATEEGWTANVRALRHVIEMRSATGAEEEIRVFAAQVARIMQDRASQDRGRARGSPRRPGGPRSTVTTWVMTPADIAASRDRLARATALAQAGDVDGARRVWWFPSAEQLPKRHWSETAPPCSCRVDGEPRGDSLCRWCGGVLPDP
jgi:thymidylate synthase (FAD)